MARLLTPEDAAARLGVSPRTVREWLRAGKLPGGCKPNGKLWRVKEDALDCFIKKLPAGGKSK